MTVIANRTVSLHSAIPFSAAAATAERNLISIILIIIIVSRLLIKDMFDLCFANGADLTILNKQNLNPLTLAAKLKRVDVSFSSVVAEISSAADDIFFSRLHSTTKSELSCARRCFSIF